MTLVDTSVAVPLVVEDHDHHLATVAAVDGRTLGLAGHAAFETFSVLTRLPAPNRRSAGAVGRLLKENSLRPSISNPSRQPVCSRSCHASASPVDRSTTRSSARRRGLTLATRDVRATATYKAIGVSFELIE